MADTNDNNQHHSRSKLNTTDSSFTDEMLKLAQTLMPEPPTTKVKRLVAGIADSGIDRQLHEFGWKAYDTVVGVANNATNRMLASPAVGNVLGGAIDIMLRYQRFNAAVAGAFFAALWPAVGLPSATEVEAIRGEVRSMREELRDAVEKSRNGHPVALVEPGLAEPRKASVYQFSVWSGWPGEDPTEAGEDVGN